MDIQYGEKREVELDKIKATRSLDVDGLGSVGLLSLGDRRFFRKSKKNTSESDHKEEINKAFGLMKRAGIGLYSPVEVSYYSDSRMCGSLHVVNLYYPAISGSLASETRLRIQKKMKFGFYEIVSIGHQLIIGLDRLFASGDFHGEVGSSRVMFGARTGEARLVDSGDSAEFRRQKAKMLTKGTSSAGPNKQTTDAQPSPLTIEQTRDLDALARLIIDLKNPEVSKKFDSRKPDNSIYQQSARAFLEELNSVDSSFSPMFTRLFDFGNHRSSQHVLAIAPPLPYTQARSKTERESTQSQPSTTENSQPSLTPSPLGSQIISQPVSSHYQLTVSPSSSSINHFAPRSMPRSASAINLRAKPENRPFEVQPPLSPQTFQTPLRFQREDHMEHVFIRANKSVEKPKTVFFDDPEVDIIELEHPFSNTSKKKKKKSTLGDTLDFSRAAR